MKNLMILTAVTMTILAGCALRPDNRPIAARVCVDASQESPEQTAYLRKKAAGVLREYGFTLATEQCDVTTRYHRLGAFQGEAVHLAPLWVSLSGYWSQEGMVTTTAADGRSSTRIAVWRCAGMPPNRNSWSSWHGRSSSRPPGTTSPPSRPSETVASDGRATPLQRATSPM